MDGLVKKFLSHYQIEGVDQVITYDVTNGTANNTNNTTDNTKSCQMVSMTSACSSQPMKGQAHAWASSLTDYVSWLVQPPQDGHGTRDLNIIAPTST